MLKNLLVIGLLYYLFIPCLLNAQDIRIFKVSDFELKGPVQSCEVITDYGKEIFEFNEDGLLLTTTTQYNDADKDVTIYKYGGGHLLEKRLESYKDNTLDLATSMVYFYEIDSVGPLSIKEKVISLDKDFYEQQEYFYDADGKLDKIMVSNENGVDEIKISYDNYKEEKTTSQFLNGILQKSIRVSNKKNKKGEVFRIELTKEFVDGDPLKAIEKRYDANDRIINEKLFKYDLQTEAFVQQESLNYAYDEMGVLSKIEVTRDKTVTVKNFIFQFDDGNPKNWVKKIITPDNTYTTRKIDYYFVPETENKPN
ncbi:MAG: hypothetical protein HKO09_12760 [Croceitalea sp.]|nr:hypothetical protein [Croceitalea sp.]